MTLHDWLRTRTFLQPVADVRARLDAAIAGADVPPAPVPDWDRYRTDFAAGVPLLRSAKAAVDLGPTERAVDALADRMESENGDRSDPGLLRCAAWGVLCVSLRRVLAAFAEWRDDDRWLRRYCPTCGSLPAMAQLAGVDPGRRRYLACGGCGTRWRYGRTICPFCEVESSRLASLAIEGEAGLRIDFCESCRAYLKTYDGQGDEEVLLADWTSLHLDVLARDRGLIRAAASLYDLDLAPRVSHHEIA